MTQQNTILGTEEIALIPPTSDEKTMAVLSHILTLVGGFIAPLVIYLIKKDQSPFATAHARESLNFQITLIIAYIVCVILAFIIIGLFLMAILGITALVLIIMATIKASEGKLYKYPFSIKFVK
jgi:uncharacterized Tic20 family protein